MSPLAAEIYEILRVRVPSHEGRINYQSLVEQLSPDHGITTPNDTRLNPAYSEIVQACRRRGLSPLTSILVKLEDGQLTYPGPGYFDAAHPGIDEENKLIAWAHDLEQTRATTYPEHLEYCL